MKIVLIYLEKVRNKYIYKRILELPNTYSAFACKFYCVSVLSTEVLKLLWTILVKEKEHPSTQLLQPQRSCG